MLHFNLANSYARRGSFDKALIEAEAVVRTGPKILQGYVLAAGVLLELDRIDEAREMYRRALAAGFDIPAVHSGLLYIAFGTGDKAAQEIELRWFERTPDDTGPLREQANNAMADGQVTRATELYRRAERLSGRPVSPNNPGRYLAELAIASATLGICDGTNSRRSAEPLANALCGTKAALRKYAASVDDKTGPQAYARGLASLRSGEPIDAAAIFNQMLARRVADWGPEYPAALVGLAREAQPRVVTLPWPASITRSSSACGKMPSPTGRCWWRPHGNTRLCSEVAGFGQNPPEGRL